MAMNVRVLARNGFLHFTVVLGGNFSIIIKDMEESNYIVLASNSPRRKELFELTGLPFRVVPPASEPRIADGEIAEDFVKRSSLCKAEEVASVFKREWVIGADTVVVVSGKVMGKPGSEAEAERMLFELSGKTHEVLTGVCVANRLMSVERVEVEKTLVKFREISADEIRAYVRTGEPLDKAGAYGIQGVGALLVERIEGSYSNVVGLPLALLIAMLKEEGAIEPSGDGRGMYRLRNGFNPLEGGVKWGKSLKT